MEKKRILIIDDEPGFTRLLRFNLERNGSYEVKDVNNGGVGFRAAVEFRPDLILLDIVMPDIDGGSVAAQLKADEKTRNVPILFLTATLTKQEMERYGGMISGYPVLAKPVTAEEVMASIQEHLGKRKGTDV